MLQQMRALSKSWVSSLFLGALALSFALWGIADVFRSNTDTTVAYVGKTEISYDTFTSEYRNATRDESRRTGVELTADKARAMGLDQATLQKLITRAAIDNFVRELGLSVSDAEVAAKIRSIEAFNGPLGTFDHNTFLQLIRERGYTEQSFIEALRSDAERVQLLSPVEGGFQMPAGYLRALFAYSTEMRAAEYVTITQQSIGTIAAPDDATLTAYVKAHPERFSTPEYRDVTYASIGPEDVMSGVNVTEDQIKQQYEVLKTDPASGYLVPEKRELEQINFPSEAEAKAGRAKIDGGTSFTALATARGLKPSDIALGALVAADLDKARSAAAFSLAADGISAPVKATFGWVLLHVTKITPGVAKTYEETKDQIKKDLAAKIAGDKLYDIVNVYTDAASGGADVEEAAKKAGMHFGHIAAIDANGLTPDGAKAAIADPGFVAAIFKAEVGEEGDPFPTKEGRFFAIKVNGTAPPKVKELAAVRAEASGVWIAEQRILRLRAKALALTAQANKEHSLAAIAKALGTSVQTTQALGRPHAQSAPSAPSFSTQLLVDLFGTAYGAAVSGPVATGDGYIIARVTGIVHPLAPPGDATMQSGMSELSNQIAGDVTISLSNAARVSQGVKVNQKLLTQAAGGEGS